MSSKEIAVLIPENTLGDEHQYIIVGGNDRFITFRFAAEEVPFYYGLLKECAESEWSERMKEKRWFTDEVSEAVNVLLQEYATHTRR
jgi:hypothetical protein